MNSKNIKLHETNKIKTIHTTTNNMMFNIDMVKKILHFHYFVVEIKNLQNLLKIKVDCYIKIVKNYLIYKQIVIIQTLKMVVLHQLLQLLGHYIKIWYLIMEINYQNTKIKYQMILIDRKASITHKTRRGVKNKKNHVNTTQPK